MPRKSASPPQAIRLQKILKQSLRRCVYRRWEATVKGTVLITQTTDLERMYRGNTPYPVGKPKVARRVYSSNRLAKEAGQRMATSRARLGYRAA
jgi:hypothetical protein